MVAWLFSDLRIDKGSGDGQGISVKVEASEPDLFEQSMRTRRHSNERER